MTALLLVLLASAEARAADFSAAVVTSHPERFSLCVSAHPARPLELDLCSGLDRGVFALTSHLFARKTWRWRSLDVGFGVGAGGRISRYCPVEACALSAGPEGLVSLEGVLWLTPAFGLTLQLDGGVAVLWAQAAPGLWEPGLRFPARLLFGVAL
ncbi:MAG: hypothetical protein JNK82_39255 [Myxococcaceae bacterium]|nr:hypothetical protein [Myxococcaceae bacterium]